MPLWNHAINKLLRDKYDERESAKLMLSHVRANPEMYDNLVAAMRNATERVEEAEYQYGIALSRARRIGYTDEDITAVLNHWKEKAKTL